MSRSRLLLAVDGGGTQTRALVTDLEGRVLGRGVGPASNHHRVGLEHFRDALSLAIDGALREAGAALPFAAACFGLAGVDGPEDEERVSRWAREQAVAERVRVVNDSELILAAGTPQGWGVALISGTGSVCLARHPDGRTARAGGWGYLLGDEGSGYQLALRALRACTQTADGRAQAHALLEAVLRHWSLPNAQALIGHVHAGSTGQAEIAALAGVVLDLASAGDPAAQALAGEAAQDLARHVETVVRRLGLTRPPLALAGGLMQSHLRAAVLAALRCEPGPVSHVADPPMGAVVLAGRMLAEMAPSS
jgi:N-acetylglucosamine kinase-like BadF-type ATPase